MAMSDPMTPENATPIRKWLGPVLLISLAVNLFLAGLFAVGYFKDGRHHRGGHGMSMGMPHHVVARHLSDDERQALRATMREHRSTFQPLFNDLKAARLALSEAVAADPYEPEAVRDAFASMRAGMDALATQSQGALVEAFADLSPESRDKIAEALKQGRRGDRMRGEGRPMRGAPPETAND
jgi:uncharacterized membrane protein